MTKRKKAKGPAAAKGSSDVPIGGEPGSGFTKGSQVSSNHVKNLSELNPSQSSPLEGIHIAESNHDLIKFFTEVTSESFSPNWETSDLRAILLHQLSAPMVFDFCSSLKSWVAAEETQTWKEEKASTPKNYNDLFNHHSPSIKLLDLTKQFAKINWKHPESPIPSAIAAVLYYMCIAVAFVRLGKWITKLSRIEVRSGFTWIQSQSWVDKSTKLICNDAVKLLKLESV